MELRSLFVKPLSTLLFEPMADESLIVDDQSTKVIFGAPPLRPGSLAA